MYYRLCDDIALRSWLFISGAFYRKHETYAQGLKGEEFELMLLCDGEHDLESSDLLESLVKRQLIEKCEKGEKPNEWSAYKSYKHRYFPKMNFMITGKCNYNCLHCFNAADNAPIMTEWTYEQAIDLLDQARECGVNAFTITGGEPMLHPRFMDIVSAIYERGMFIEELNTNGYFLTQEILDKMKEIGCIPYIKISFDGLGCHDWMRDRKGAEQRTLAAMELCVKNGFRVMSQTQVHKRNLHTLIPTAKKLAEIGVDTLRLIRTTEVPRWEENAPDSCLPIEDYYQAMLDFMREYKGLGLDMDIIIWQFMKAYPKHKNYHLDAVLCPTGKFNPTDPICKGNRGMIGVTSSGDIVPCLQMSGYFEEKGIHLGNLHTTPLSELLIGGDYMKLVCANLHNQLKNNQKCAACKFYGYCNGGCPALGGLYSPKKLDLYGCDITKCIFYENGWYFKVLDAMEGWSNTTPIDIFEREINK
ncbi:MAG: radical SAM protein [Ruminococcus sp.]|nr:radical SAM protein [Ruminococcus sp.]